MIFLYSLDNKPVCKLSIWVRLPPLFRCETSVFLSSSLGLPQFSRLLYDKQGIHNQFHLLINQNIIMFRIGTLSGFIPLWYIVHWSMRERIGESWTRLFVDIAKTFSKWKIANSHIFIRAWERYTVYLNE